jgi:hypothetical protein
MPSKRKSKKMKMSAEQSILDSNSSIVSYKSRQVLNFKRQSFLNQNKLTEAE